MCGIVGYIGRQNATPIVLNGLKKLEYRGYDSAGLAVLTNRIISKYDGCRQISASCGVGAESTDYGKVGIGHTRWATHGEPTARNAHPHVGSDRRRWWWFITGSSRIIMNSRKN